MKLATYQDGSRDGQLVVVARDLGQAHYATGIANRLQQVLDDWNFLAPQLTDLYTDLNAGRAPHPFPFEPARCMAPLPRAGQWVSGTAYPQHAQRLGGALWHQGASDDFRGPCEPITVPSEDMDIDFEAGLAAITGDVPMGAAPHEALAGVRLLMLAHAVVLRRVAEGEQAAGRSLLRARPAAAFSPVAATPDELGEAWQGGRVHLTLQCTLNGRRFGLCEAGPEMAMPFGELIAHLAATRNLRAGAIVGSGPVSNQDSARGYACIAEKRAAEAQDGGQAVTGYLRYGDSVRIEMKNRAGQSVFGALDQEVAPPA